MDTTVRSGRQGEPSQKRRSSYAGEGTTTLAQETINRRFSVEEVSEVDSGGLHVSNAVASASERRRKQLQLYMATSTVGYVFDVLNGFFSIVSLMIVIANMYIQGFLLNMTDFIICCFFLFDYSLRLYLADSRFQQLLSPASVIDLVTILPTFATIVPTFVLGDFSLDDLEYKTSAIVFFASEFTLYYIRILRLMRLRRLLYYMESEEKREISLTILGIVTALFFMTAVLYGVENYYRRLLMIPVLEFHEYFYFLVATLSTVGYGDVVAATYPGKLLVTAIICLALFYIPKSTNRILRNLNTRSIYSTKSYYPSNAVAHVVVTGYIDAVSARDFLKEIFHSDHGSSNVHVVFLIKAKPTRALVDLIESPIYRSVVTYLEGCPMSSKDLTRAAVPSASACFILANKFSTAPAKSDAIAILKALSMKRFVLKQTGRDVLICAQFIRPESKNLFAISRTSLPCTLLDQVISIEQIKMDIFAKSCLCPGLNAILSNLIGSTEDEEGEGADYNEGQQQDRPFHLRGQPFRGNMNSTVSRGRSSVATESTATMKMSDPSSGLKDEALGSKWMEEYKRGRAFEIYRTKLSPVFEQVPFTELVELVYRRIGVLVFAIDILAPNSRRQRVVLNPGTFKIPKTEELNVHAFVIAKDESDADLSYSAGTSYSTAKRMLYDEVSALKQTTPTKDGRDSTLGSFKMFNMNMTGDDVQASPLTEGSTRSLISQSKKDVHKLWTSLREDLNGREEYETDDFVHYKISDTYITLEEATIHTSLEKELPSVSSHIVFVGGFENTVSFVRTLRAKYLTRMIPVVFLSMEPPSSHLWQKLNLFPFVFFVKGSPFDSKDLIRAGIKFAKQAVVVASNPNGARSITHGTLRDANGILARQTILQLNPSIDLVVEIINNQNLYLLSDYKSSAKAEGKARGDSVTVDDIEGILEVLEFQKAKKEYLELSSIASVASGSVFPTSTLDTLLCQSFFNPHLLSVLQSLISGSHSPLLDSLRAEVESHTGAFDESNLYQVKIPKEFIGKNYGRLLRFLVLRNNAVPLGLLRSNPADDGHEGTKYVSTNPASGTVLRGTDFVFVLSLHPPVDAEEDKASLIMEDLREKLARDNGGESELLSFTKAELEEFAAKVEQQLHQAEQEISKLRQTKRRLTTASSSISGTLSRETSLFKLDESEIVEESEFVEEEEKDE